MAHKLEIFCESPDSGDLSNELKSKYQPNEYLLASETNAVLRGATIGVKLLYDVIDCDDITLGYNTAATEFVGQTEAITKGLLAATNGNMATVDKLGTIKVGYQADTSGDSRNYPLKVDANGNAYTTVPWSMAEGGTSDNTPDTIVRRDTDGNFSANNITANLLGNATTADKINTKVAVGNYAKPVYLSSTGVITACTESFSDYYNITMSHIECSYNDKNVTISSSELEKLVRLSNQILFLKLNYTNRPASNEYDILKLVSAVEATTTSLVGATDDYTFANTDKEVTISINHNSQELDSIIISGTTVPKATYADYAVKNADNSYSKLTQDSNSVLKVDTNYIVSKKKLLWSGEVNISTLGSVGDNIPIYTSTTDLKGKSLEIWLKDKGTLDNNNTPNSPYAIKVKVLDINEWSYLYDAEKLDMYNSKFTNSKTLAFQHISLLYNPNAFKIFGRCYMAFYNLNTFAKTTGECDCYVTAIYEIIE